MVNLLSYICLCIFLLIASPANAWQEPENRHVIYVSSISWHTGIVVPAYSLPDSLWRENHYYGDASFLEIGWGEADFYPSDGFNLWYALKSVFWPTSSVLHINPIHRQVEEYYADTDVVRIEINDEQLRRLSRYIVEGFELDENGKIIPVAAGKGPDSYFYKGSSSYYFPKNSNVWVARALERTGFSITPIWYQTTGLVLNKAEEFGELIVKED